MKRTFIILLLIFVFAHLNFLHAQTIVSEFEAGKLCKLHLNKGLSMSMKYEDVSNKLGVELFLKMTDVDVFIEALSEINRKFLEWSKTAKENEIVQMTKDIDIKLPIHLAIFTNYRDVSNVESRLANVRLLFSFNVDNKHIHYLYLAIEYKYTDSDRKGLDGLTGLIFMGNTGVNSFIEAVKKAKKANDIKIDELFN